MPIKTFTATYVSINELLSFFTDSESDTIMDAIIDGDATYGSNAVSLVSAQYLIELVQEMVDEPIATQWEQIVTMYVPADTYINLEG